MKVRRSWPSGAHYILGRGRQPWYHMCTGIKVPGVGKAPRTPFKNISVIFAHNLDFVNSDVDAQIQPSRKEELGTLICR